MHPLTQSVLVVGVLALVGMAGYVTVYGLPERDTAPTTAERLEASAEQVDDILCGVYLSKPISEFNAKGRTAWLECAAAAE